MAFKVGFQGEAGAFSQVAVRQLLGENARIDPSERFEEVFRALEQGAIRAAVIPVENTLHGSVHENYDHLLRFDLPITGETSVHIVHNLIAAPNVRLGDIKRVLSHPVALNQCLDFFAQHPYLRRVPHYDTAGSVKTIMAEGWKDAAAIASSMAAELYGAKILKRSIEDDRRNFTRFVLLQRPGDKPLIRPGKEWKTSLVFTTKNEPGALFRALAAFALRDLNLSKIESRPLRGKPFEYLFYLDVLADVRSEKAQRALGHLTEVADFFKVLGCYPKESHSGQAV